MITDLLAVLGIWHIYLRADRPRGKWWRALGVLCWCYVAAQWGIAIFG